MQKYILEILGVELQYKPIKRDELGMMPYFIGKIYNLMEVTLLNQSFILVEKPNPEEFSIMQTEIHFKIIREAFNKKVVLLASEMTYLNRRRLVEKGINFIVPGKQLFLPDFLIDLREDFSMNKNAAKKETLLPSAQFIVLYRIIHRRDNLRIEEMSFKELALKLNYTQMAITYAAENLLNHEICTIVGEKEKYLRFNLGISEMWNDLEHRKLFLNPIIKTVYVDQIVGNPFLLLCNTSALPEYSDMNPSKQHFRAIEKKLFYTLQRDGAFVNLNKYEGNICLEVWKYDPLALVRDVPNDKPVVDPLSLYLTLKDIPDERTEMALEKIIENNIW
ncbi:MAG: MarR family transcriptional regulator [Bacteroidota bacterium]